MFKILKAVPAKLNDAGCGCGPACRCETCRCKAGQPCGGACTCVN
jgi:hypothetical protein